MSYEASIRKYQDIIKCSAGAVIGFGLWSVIRIYIYFFFSYDSFCKLIEIDKNDISIRNIALISASFVAVLDLLVRFFIGRKAVKISKDKSKHIPFIIFCVVYLLFCIEGTISSFSAGMNMNDIGEFIICLIIDATSCAAIIEIIVAYNKIRALMKSKHISEKAV